MADEQEQLELNIEVNASDGAEVANEVAKGIANIRKEAALLSKESAAARLNTKESLRQLADEQKASARNLAVLRQESRAKEKADANLRLAEERAYAEEARRNSKRTNDLRVAEERAYAEELQRSAKIARDAQREQARAVTPQQRIDKAERAAYREDARRTVDKSGDQLADEQKASARNLAILRQRQREEESAANKRANDLKRAEDQAYIEDAKRAANQVAAARNAEERNVTQQLRVEAAERAAYRENEKRDAAATKEKDPRIQQEREATLQLKKEAIERAAYRENEKRDAAAAKAKDPRIQQERDVTLQLKKEAAERAAYRENERRDAAALKSKDPRIQQEREVTFQLKKEAAERAAYREDERRTIAAVSAAEKEARRASALATKEQLAAERARGAATETVRAGIVALRNEVLLLASAYVGFRFFGNIIEEGIEFNRVIETARLGIGSLIAAQVEMRDSNGRLIDGSEKLGVAVALAADQVKKMRVDSLRTVATTEQLAHAFQQATAIGLRFGLTMDQIRKLSVQMAQAAGALGVPLNQLSEEIRSLMQGTITPRNTRVATALGISNEEIRQAQQAGKLFEFITGRLQAFTVAGDAAAKTFQGVMSNIKEALQTLAGTAVAPLFDDIRREGQKALSGIFDFDTAEISSKFSDIMEVAQRIFGGIGSLLADALEAGVQGAEDFNQWLVENRDVVNDIFISVGYVVEEFKLLSQEVTGVVGTLVQMGTEMGLIGLTLRLVATTVATIHNFFQVILALLGNLGTAIINLVLRPLVGFNRVLVATIGLFNQDLAASLAKSTDTLEGFLDDVTRSTAEYTNELNRGAGALGQFIERTEKMDTASAKSAEAMDNRRNALRVAIDAEKASTKVLDEELKKKQVSQENYAKAIAKIQLESLDKQITAEKAFFDATDQSDNRQRQRTLDTIKELRQRRDAIAKAVTMKTIAEPPEAKGSDAAGFERAESIRIKQELTERLRDLKISLDQQLISYREYYDEVTKAQTKSLREQAEALDKQAAATKKPGRKAAIQAQAAALRSEIDQIGQDNEEKFRAATEKLHDEVEAANIQLLKDQGKLAEARAIEVDKKFREKFAQLQKNGDFKGADIMKQLFDIDNAKVRLQELMNITKSATDAFSAELSKINTEVENHVITETEGRERILQAYLRAQAALGAQLHIMEALAARTKDATAIAEVDALRQKFEEMGYTIRRLSDDFYDLKEAGRQGLESGISEFITSSIMNAKSWKEAWVSAAQAVVGALAQVAAKMLANLILQQTLASLMSLLGLGASIGTGFVNPGAGAVNAGIVAGVHMAEGGPVRGPGGPRDDRVPIWGSAGEFMINATSASILGQEFLHELNSLGRIGAPKRPGFYSEGGPIDVRPAQSPTQSRSDKLTVELRSNDSHIIKVMESPAGIKTQVNNLRRNKNTVTRTLRK